MSHPTFAECFCAQHGITSEQFARAVFRRALYRRALPVAWFLGFLMHDYFAADFDFIHGVERLRRLRDFASEAERFNEHPTNRGWLRRRLRLRISTHRLKRLIRETLPSEEERALAAGLPASLESGAERQSHAMTAAHF